MITKMFNNSTMRILGSCDKPYFVASDIAKLLEYTNTRKAIIDHVRDKYKTTYEQFTSKRNETSNLDLHPQTILIEEFGVYELVMKSKMAQAEKFQDWVYETILPSIRQTGQYNMKQLKCNQFVMINEFDLHKKVVDYIKRFYPKALFNATLGELSNDTQQKRIKSKLLGYSKGVPDLFIYELNKKYNGLCFEFKTPNGTGIISEFQKEWNKDLSLRNYKCITTYDYDDAIKELNDYMFYRRIKCEFCNRKFKNDMTINNHHIFFHKIKR